MAGEGPPSGTLGQNYTIHSGLAYPAVYMAKVIGFVFHLSSADSLAWVFKFLPVTVGVISIVVLYIFLARILNNRVAFFAALTWALLSTGVFLGTAGNLDRDGLSVLLLMVGAILFYLSGSWKFNIGKRNVGWLISGFSVLLIQVLLYLEWGFQGPAVMFAIILVYSVLKPLLEYSSLLEKEPNVMRRIVMVSRRSDLWAFLLVAAFNMVAVGFYYRQHAELFAIVALLLQGHAGAAEEQGLSFRNLLGFQFFLVPIGLGVYLAWKRRNDAMVLFAGWFVSFFIMSLFASRMIVLALPAACVVSGIGLASLVDILPSKESRDIWKQLGVMVLLVLLVVFSSVSAAYVNRTDYILAADKDWQEALAYLRANTPENAVIMSQWSYGYWILDVAQREPFVDNGYYGYTSEKLQDVGLAYSATDPSEAAVIMAKCGTGYLVFGKQDLDLASTILEWAGSNSKETTFPEDSLVVRSLDGDFLSGDGLELVFKNNEVVILAAAQPEQT